MFSLLLFLQVASAAGDDCSRILRDGSYREATTDGQAKVGRVDYKLINQLLMSLRQAVRENHPRPEGFEAELRDATWAEAPIGGVALRGHLKTPQILAGSPVIIELQREGVGLVVSAANANRRFERVIAPEDYLKVFPFTPPSGRGLLLGLVRGLEQDPRLLRWTELRPRR